MPDLRDDLGRLADFVGEPRGLDDLATARRRRERRRRTEGLVAGLAVLVATALFLVSVLRSDPTSSVPGTSETPPGGFVVPSVPYLWPENWADASGADALAATTAAVEAGDPAVAWRLDPEQVVRRFAAEVLGWSDLSVHGQQSGAEAQWWEVSPACPGGGCDLSMLETIRVDRLPDPGLWVVSSVEAVGLRTGYEHGRDPVAAADLAIQLEPSASRQFELDVPAGRSGHIGVVMYDGCSVRSVVDQGLASGRYSLTVPVRNDPACGGDMTGYVFAFATDDTTVPVEDPLLEAAAVEAPGLTVSPIFIADSGDAQPSASADYAIECNGSSLSFPSGPAEAQPDGVHLRVTNVGPGDVLFSIADGVKNVDLAPGETAGIVEALDPGEHFVLCDTTREDAFTRSFDVSDPSGYWFDPDPVCSAAQATGADLDAAPLEVQGDPTDEMLSAADNVFRSNIAGTALERGYQLRMGGYPNQADERLIVAVDADGKVRGLVRFTETDSQWYPANYVTCDATAIS